MRKCNRHILEALELARMLTILADEGEVDAEDDSCAVLYCIIRDSAYKIRRRAEEEREAHRRVGRWEEDADAASRGRVHDPRALEQG